MKGMGFPPSLFFMERNLLRAFWYPQLYKLTTAFRAFDEKEGWA
jgi:hypothetical protein